MTNPPCRIELLGQTRLIQQERILTRFGSQKAARLLACLVLRPGPHSREQLIDRFWPDMELTQGRANLSNTLGLLRRLLEPPGCRKGSVLTADHQSVGLHPAALTTDVADFERLLKQAEAAPGAAARAALLGQAVALYTGDLLPGVYDDWAVREADRLRLCFTEALPAWADALEAAGDIDGALKAARVWAGAEPDAEASHLRVIGLLALAGCPAEAREAWLGMERRWREEWGAAPPPEVRQEAISRLGLTPPEAERLLGQVGQGQSRARPKKAVAPPVPSAPASLPGATPLPPAVLPVLLDAFFGREAEADWLAQTLLPSKDDAFSSRRPCRLVTLTGAGGTGKTRLSLEFAARAAQVGLWCGFVSLADVEEAGQVPARIADALSLPVSAAPPLDRLADFFTSRVFVAPMRQGALLVLDNLEQISAAEGEGESEGLPGVLSLLLERIPGLTCLCTSRRPVGLRGERLFPLDPLPVPEAGESDNLAALLRVPSVGLYVDRAQAVRPDFSLTPGNASAVVSLCRLLEGSPLAVELAAAWVRTAPPRRMWERLSAGLGVSADAPLEARYGDVPVRQRSLRAALDWSYRLLSARQRRLLARLSVFRGGLASLGSGGGLRGR